MTEIINEKPEQGVTQEDIMFECLRNITVCLYNEKAEIIRKTIESNNKKDLDELLRSVIQSTLIEISLGGFINEKEIRDKRYLNVPKLKAIEKIMRRCAYMRDHEVLMIFQITKILTSSHHLTYSSQELDKADIFSIAKELNLLENEKSLNGKDLNLSLNSHSNSKKDFDVVNENDWGVDEKGDYLISNYLECNPNFTPKEFEEEIEKRKICKKKHLDKLFYKTSLLSQGLSDKTTIASLERNNFAEQTAFNQEFCHSDHIIAPDLKPNKERVPSFLRKSSTTIINPFFPNKPGLTKFAGKWGKDENFLINNESDSCNDYNNNMTNSMPDGLFDKKKYARQEKPTQLNNPSFIRGFDSKRNKKRLEKQNTSGSEATILEENKKTSKGNVKEAYMKIMNEENKNFDDNKTDIDVDLTDCKFHNNTNQRDNHKNMEILKTLNALASTVNGKKDFFTRIKGDACGDDESKSDLALIAQKNANLNKLSSAYKINSEQIDFQSKSGSKTKKGRKSGSKRIASDAAENFIENEEIKKFNSWNNQRNIAKQMQSGRNMNIPEDLSLEKDQDVYSDLDSGFNGSDKSMFLGPQRPNKNKSTKQMEKMNPILKYLKIANKLEKEINVPKDFKEEDKRIFDYLFKKFNKIYNNKNNNNNTNTSTNSNYNNNNDNIYLNEIVRLQNLESKRNYKDSKHKSGLFSDCNSPLRLNRESAGNKKYNPKSEEENSDSGSRFSIESEFFTNNKKVYRPKQQIYLNDSNNDESLKKQFRSCYKRQLRDSRNTLNDSNYMYNPIDDMEKNDMQNFNIFTQQENSFSSQMSYELPLNTNNEINTVSTPNPIFSSGNGLPQNYRRSEFENESNYAHNDNFVRKFNTSDAAKPPKILMELNEAKNLTNNDPMLIVTAEIDAKKKLMENIFGSYQGSNYKPNRSASNESKDINNTLVNNPSCIINNLNPNRNSNTFNSRETFNNNSNYDDNNNHNFNGNNNNNNNYNLNNFNGSQSHNSVYNRQSTQYKHNKTSEEKEHFKNFLAPNTNSKLISDNSVINTNNLNFNNNTINNSNISTKKKPLQKNQIFFPTEINIKNLNPNNK